MVNPFTIVQLITGIIFGTMSLVSLINSAIAFAMYAIIAMAVSDYIIQHLEINYNKSNSPR